MALFDDYQTILFSRRGRILEVTLNRPDKLNATDGVLHTELARVFVDISNDPDSDIVAATFCAPKPIRDARDEKA